MNADLVSDAVIRIGPIEVDTAIVVFHQVTSKQLGTDTQAIHRSGDNIGGGFPELPGATHGVTIVISPLLSLIQDQISGLTSKGIPAEFLSGTMEQEDRRRVFAELRETPPKLRLLYVTPEMLNQSQQAQSALEMLHKKNLLARFVIDEAHCLSQWGHDFRPDYKNLKTLKSNYPGIPLMALTATANQKVKTDVKTNLGMMGCTEFAMSFNRKNLTYEVKLKGKNMESEIEELITKRWKNQCGIIYCTSKKSCEQVADNLAKKRISIHHYHAGLEKEDRARIQEEWATNKINVIVATVAFGSKFHVYIDLYSFS